MGRNFFRRIEVAFPVEDAELKARVLEEGIDVYLRDNQNAWILDADARWSKATATGDAPFCAQQALLAKFRGAAAAAVAAEAPGED